MMRIKEIMRNWMIKRWLLKRESKVKAKTIALRFSTTWGLSTSKEHRQIPTKYLRSISTRYKNNSYGIKDFNSTSSPQLLNKIINK